jgi:diguanylate cyclase (GGDEF)-like protein
MLDIDYFKSINDVYGYPFGDLVLQQLAQQLKRMVRRYDIIIRFSGEEFIILCPGTERSTALTLAQRLLDAFNLYNFGDKKHNVKLKLSIAVASYPEDKIVKGIDLIELVEHMVIKIKEDGGNRVYSSLDMRKKKYHLMRSYEKDASVNILKKKIDKLNKQANQSLIEAIFAFAKTIEVKDHYTGEHVEKTVYYATEIARALGLSKDEIERIKQAAMLHDLGKIGISEKILLKKSKLTPKEFEIIKTHPQLGVDIIRPIQFLHAIIPLIFYHHERWDGKGYPTGLGGEDIPFGARIIAVADVYQALISDRPYRKAYPRSEVIKIMKEGAGTQFDPQIINVFLKILKQNHH